MKVFGRQARMVNTACRRRPKYESMLIQILKYGRSVWIGVIWFVISPGLLL